MNLTQHTYFMSLALNLAERGAYSVSPNPKVGCVLVNQQHIVGEGFHIRARGAHAEIYALQKAGAKAEGATAYITLEPCCHHGNTPPCTTALIKAGIKKVFIACLDPNPLMCGKGIAELRSAGIAVEVGLCSEEAKRLNEIFFHYIVHRTPFVIAKWAMSLDGKTIVNEDDQLTISGMQSHHHAHKIRQQVDAILIGANTLRKDNPQLTARYLTSSPKQPLRIVLAGKKSLPKEAKIFDDTLPGKTIIVSTPSSPKIHVQGIESWVLPGEDGLVHIPSLLNELGKKEITSLLVEGGMTVHQHFFKHHQVNKIHVYLAGKVIASLNPKMAVENMGCSKIGQDFYFTADFKRHSDV